MPRRRGTIIREIMRTETANLPGKWLRKRHRQFRAVCWQISCSSFIIMATCLQVAKHLLFEQCSTEWSVFGGQFSSDCVPTIWSQQHMTDCLAHLSVSVDWRLNNEQCVQSVKPVNIYVLHYHAVRSCAQTRRVQRRTCNHTH